MDFFFYLQICENVFLNLCFEGVGGEMCGLFYVFV